MEGYKVCIKCHLLLPTSAFAKNAARKDGLQNMCKECRRKYDAERLPIRKQIAEENRSSLTIKEKTCPTCGRTLPIRYFYNSCANPDGYSTYCKTCLKKRYKKVEKKDKKQHKGKDNTTK